MPLYEYKCEKCGHRFEKLVFGKRTVKCPKCESEHLKKLFSTFATKKSGGETGTCESGTCPLYK